MPDLRSFDYIIVGGGTAACVLANRLTEDSSVRVLMLEAGPEPTSMWIKMPLAMGKLFTHPILNWGFSTEPEAQLNNRIVFWPRGKVLGGCSCINGSAYIRGQAEDYDGWKRQGNTGWGWSDVLPYFQKIERREDPRGRPTHDSKNGSKNGKGMVAVSYPTYVHPIARAFIEAGVRAGLPAADDLNGAVREGISLMPYSVHRGVRQSSAEAYLRPARTRPNLVVETSAFVRRVLLEGRKAAGVEYESNGALQKALATREVILAAGSIGSPQILMLSGVGPGKQLQEHGIAVVMDAPGVGENLHDHASATCTYRTAPGNSLNRQVSGLRAVGHAISYYLAKRGPLTNGASEATALARGLSTSPCPDLQIVFRPMSYVYDKTGRIAPDPDTESDGRRCLRSTEIARAAFLEVCGPQTGAGHVRELFGRDERSRRAACRAEMGAAHFPNRAAEVSHPGRRHSGRRLPDRR